MAEPQSNTSLEPAVAEALAAAWGTVLGGAATIEPSSAAPEGEGWLAEVPLSGSVRGRLAAWFSHDAVVAAVEHAPRPDGEAPAPDPADLLTRVMAETAAAIGAAGELAGAEIGQVAIDERVVPPSGPARSLAIEGQTPCPVVLLIEVLPVSTSIAPAVPTAEPPQLDAVLDVEMPLTVRFGQVVMPLHTLADLGPGSVVDMGRSPEEPVELLVGTRVIARGDVVVVGGNYGIRITELTAGAPKLRDLEASAS